METSTSLPNDNMSISNFPPLASTIPTINPESTSSGSVVVGTTTAELERNSNYTMIITETPLAVATPTTASHGHSNTSRIVIGICVAVMVVTVITIAAILIGVLVWRKSGVSKQHSEPASSVDRLDLANPNYDSEYTLH